MNEIRRAERKGKEVDIQQISANIGRMQEIEHQAMMHLKAMEIAGGAGGSQPAGGANVVLGTEDAQVSWLIRCWGGRERGICE